MNPSKDLPGLALETASLPPDSPLFRPREWPPAPDHPVTLDKDGNVVSVYGENTWDFSHWAGRTLKVSFDRAKRDYKARKIDERNASLLKAVAAWLLYGPGACRAPRTLITYIETVKFLFAICTENGIVASDLMRFPRVRQKVVSELRPSAEHHFFTIMSRLVLSGGRIGFVLLDQDGLKELARANRQNTVSQTPYVPPRIWAYQVNRLKECIDDFRVVQDGVSKCFEFCLNAYTNNGTQSGKSAFDLTQDHRPFNCPPGKNRDEGFVFHDAFVDTAQRFGIAETISKWVGPVTLQNFATYLTLTRSVGLAYCMNFSMMRADEAAMLRVGCYGVEADPGGFDIHTVSGSTTKLGVDDEVHWIVGESVKYAIEVCSVIALLRVQAASLNPKIEMSDVDRERPFLLSRVHEPWGRNIAKSNTRLKMRSYAVLVSEMSKLFDTEQLRITNEDSEIARKVTFGLDEKAFAVGSPWPLAWHQLRRTGAVNMLASGKVSDSSLQYQLKHLRRAMALYYGQNHHALDADLTDEAKSYFLKEFYSAVANAFEEMTPSKFTSPHGEKREVQILRIVNQKDHEALIKAARTGKIGYKDTFLGRCVKPGPPCPLGGISNITGCMGFGDKKPCEYKLLEERKRSEIEKLKLILELEKADAEKGSPFYDSISAQLEAASRALKVLDERRN